MGFRIVWRSAGWTLASLACQAAIAAPADGAALRIAGVLPPAALEAAARVLASADHGGLPFAIVDKKAAMLLVYEGDGRLIGATPALLGQTRGDHSTPGVGERSQTGGLRISDQTTAAGRYVSEPGRSLAGEPIVWIDYANALAIHRLRPGPSQAQRARRLASSSAPDRRVSAGCVVVPVRFYEAVVQPVLGRGRGMVYVMAEDGRPLQSPAALASDGL